MNNEAAQKVAHIMVAEAWKSIAEKFSMSEDQVKDIACGSQGKAAQHKVAELMADLISHAQKNLPQELASRAA